MRYLKLATSVVMFFTLYQAVRGTVLFHTTTEHHTPLTANLIGTMALTSFACLILLTTIWNYQAILREENA